MKKRYKITVAFCAIGIVVIALSIFIRNHNNREHLLDLYARGFGYSLDDIKYEVEDYYHESAFQDPSATFMVRVDSKIDGTLFDVINMTAGLGLIVNGVLKSHIDELQKMGWPVPDNSDDYLMKTLNNGNSKMYVIYGINEEKYWVIWEG